MPIVDTIKEEEKYGNDGDRPFDRALVSTLEKISVFVNKVIEVRTFANTLYNRAEQLNNRISNCVIVQICSSLFMCY